MHETKTITVTEFIKRERLGNRSGARHWRDSPLHGFTSTSPKEQRRSTIRVRLKAMRIGRLECPEQRVKGGFWG